MRTNNCSLPLLRIKLTLYTVTKLSINTKVISISIKLSISPAVRVAENEASSHSMCDRKDKKKKTHTNKVIL